MVSVSSAGQVVYEAPEAPPGDDPPLYHVLRIGVADVYRHVGQLCCDVLLYQDQVGLQ